MKFTMAQTHTTRHTQTGKYDVVPIMCSFLQPLFRYESKKGVRRHSAKAMTSHQRFTCSTLTSRVCNPAILQRESAANTRTKNVPWLLRTRVCYWTGQLLGESVRIGGRSCNIFGWESARGLTGPPWFAKSSQSISHCRSIMYLKQQRHSC